MTFSPPVESIAAAGPDPMAMNIAYAASQAVAAPSPAVAQVTPAPAVQAQLSAVSQMSSRSLSQLISLSADTAAKAPNPAKFDPQTMTDQEINALQTSSLHQISVLNLRVDQIAGLTMEAFKHLMPSTDGP